MRRSLCLLLPGLLGLACSQGTSDELRVQPPTYGAGTASIEVALGSALVPGSLEVFLDDASVTEFFESVPGGASGSVPLAAGDQMLFARARFGGGDAAVWRSQLMPLRPPPALPPLVTSDPPDASDGVARSAWIRLEFARGVAPLARESFELACDGVPHALRVDALDAATLVVNPAGQLPAGADCALAWRGRDGREELVFATAPAGPIAVVAYNRADARQTAPFPDDFWLRERLEIDFAGLEEPDVWLIDALLADTRRLDGFSPLAHLVVALSAPADPATVPATSAESLDPLATVALFDLAPGSERYGQRVPFRAEARPDPTPGSNGHALLVFPSVPLTPGGRYGLVVTRRLLADASRPFDASIFFQLARDGVAVPGEPEALARVRELSGEVLDFAANRAEPPIPRDDVALAVRFSVRTTDALPDDLRAIKEQVLAEAPPAVTIESVEAEAPDADGAGSEVAVVVRGTWDAPDWRRDTGNLARDPESGRPIATGSRRVEFVLALPDAAFEGPVPAIFYQHGNPGSAEEEVVEHARRSLAGSGFAVIGFTDPLNREVSPPGPGDEVRAQLQVDEILMRLLANGRPPDYFVQTVAEQLAFLRVIEEIAGLERFRIDEPEAGAPREIFGIDGSAPLGYVGISEGANHGPALLPFAPEIRAAALVAGGRRFSEVLIHQAAHRFLAPIAFLGLRQLTWIDVWVALALFQTILDDQDAHNFAPYLYREPLEIPGGGRRASVLLVEGLEDSLVPNHATESLAWALGPLPQLGTPASAVPFLESAAGPLVANIDANTTAALVQYVPQGVDGVAATPGCASPPLSPRSAREGHYCAQSAAESLQQRALFFESALSDDAPVIVDLDPDRADRAE